MPDVCGMLKICRDAKKHPREATEIFSTVFGLSTHTTFHSFEPVVTCVPLNTRISIFYGARIENLLLIGYFTSDVLVYVWPAQPIKWKISFPDIIILYTYMWHTYTTSNVNGNQYRLLWVSFSASIRNFRRPDFICVFFSSLLGQSLFVLQPSIAMYDTLSLPCVRDSDFGDITSPFSYENFIFI